MPDNWAHYDPTLPSSSTASAHTPPVPKVAYTDRIAELERALLAVRDHLDGIAYEISDDNTDPADHAEINGHVVLAQQAIRAALRK